MRQHDGNVAYYGDDLVIRRALELESGVVGPQRPLFGEHLRKGVIRFCFRCYFVEPSFVVIKVLQRLPYSRVFDIPHDVLLVVKRAELDLSRSGAGVTGLPRHLRQRRTVGSRTKPAWRPNRAPGVTIGSR